MAEASAPGRSPVVVPGYEIIRLLGQGGYGGVWLARKEATGEQFAIKLLDRNTQLKERIEREITNHSRLVHPNIVRFYEVILVENYLCIVMEYVACGDVFQYVVRVGRPGLPESEARYIFQQLIRAVDYMHDQGVCSRDIKLDNCLLSSDSPPLVKLCDFGFSKSEIDSIPKSKVGTPQSLPPEVILHPQYDGKMADLWSCGVMLYAMLAGQFPFQRREDAQVAEGLQRNQLVMKRILSVDYLMPAGASEEAKNLLANLLVRDPNQRLCISDIQRHCFFVQGLTHEWYQQSKILKMHAPPTEAQTPSAIGAVFDNARKAWAAEPSADMSDLGDDDEDL